MYDVSGSEGAKVLTKLSIERYESRMLDVGTHDTRYDSVMFFLDFEKSVFG
jgi:hypothetical protein